VPPSRRPRAHHRVNAYPGARRQNETEMFSDHDETSLSIAAVSSIEILLLCLSCQSVHTTCMTICCSVVVKSSHV